MFLIGSPAAASNDAFAWERVGASGQASRSFGAVAATHPSKYEPVGASPVIATTVALYGIRGAIHGSRHGGGFWGGIKGFARSALAGGIVMAGWRYAGLNYEEQGAAALFAGNAVRALGHSMHRSFTDTRPGMRYELHMGFVSAELDTREGLAVFVPLHETALFATAMLFSGLAGGANAYRIDALNLKDTLATGAYVTRLGAPPRPGIGGLTAGLSTIAYQRNHAQHRYFLAHESMHRWTRDLTLDVGFSSFLFGNGEAAESAFRVGSGIRLGVRYDARLPVVDTAMMYAYPRLYEGILVESLLRRP